MSLGYQKPYAADPVRVEVERCFKEDITIFASASNEGANAPRTCPAGYEEVLCIYSTTPLGNPSAFNPTASRHKGGPHFCVLGEEINSYWPEPDRRTRRMSGTSYATPVAVCIAVFMIRYIQTHLGDVEWNITPVSPQGIKALFLEIANGNHNGAYDIVSPMHIFSNFNNPGHLAAVRARLMEALLGFVRQ